MKAYSIVLVFLLGLGSAHGQTVQEFSHKPQHPIDNSLLSGEEWRLMLLARLVSFPSPVTNGAAQLYGMGDEAAVDVLKLLGTRSSLAPAEIQATLDIIHMAFEHPGAITNHADRSPRAALFLLQHLGSTTDDATVRQRITQETTFLRAAMIAAVANPSTPKQ